MGNNKVAGLHTRVRQRNIQLRNKKKVSIKP